MTKYLLTDWEINGYDDSDFMCTYWDDVERRVFAHCYGTTRAAAPTNIGWNGDVSSVVVGDEPCLAPTVEKVEEARQWLEGYIFDRLEVADVRMVDTPDVKDLHAGLEVRLLADCRMQVNETEPCAKCFGVGKWVNPRNIADKRDCFGCKGTKVHIIGKKKDANGKLVFEKLNAGMHGTVVDWRSFGQFYRNGYNQPGRGNTTVQFCVDGRTVRASLEKIRLHREYEDKDSLREKAKSLSFNYQFSAIYPKHAWDTHNFAAQVAKESA